MGTWFKNLVRPFFDNFQKMSQECKQFSYGTLGTAFELKTDLKTSKSQPDVNALSENGIILQKLLAWWKQGPHNRSHK